MVKTPGIKLNHTRNGWYQEFNKYATLIAEGSYVNDRKNEHGRSTMITQGTLCLKKITGMEFSMAGLHPIIPTDNSLVKVNLTMVLEKDTLEFTTEKEILHGSYYLSTTIRLKT